MQRSTQHSRGSHGPGNPTSAHSVGMIDGSCWRGYFCVRVLWDASLTVSCT
jgi:hypothetical protein